MPGLRWTGLSDLEEQKGGIEGWQESEVEGPKGVSTVEQQRPEA